MSLQRWQLFLTHMHSIIKKITSRLQVDRSCVRGVRFWSQYANIDALVAELDLGVQPFTGWVQSRFLSPAGLEVTAPVLQDRPRLPTPLGAALSVIQRLCETVKAPEGFHLWFSGPGSVRPA